MPYILLNKEVNEFKLYGSLPILIEKTGLEIQKLEYHFSRKKEKEFENNKYRIAKVELQRSGEK